MSVCIQKLITKNTDRMNRMRSLISHDQCRCATQGSGWSLPDRFLYRGMRALLFNRDLEALRQAAKRALQNDLDSGGELDEASLDYFRVAMRIWALRWKSVAFVFGFHVNADGVLDLLTVKSG
jgi:hypothetical protein